jgi:hypothetical protein
MAQALADDAVPLRRLRQAREPGVVHLTGDLDEYLDILDADRRLAIDAESPACVEAPRRRRPTSPRSRPLAVATLRSVTPAQASSASSSMSPEHPS